MYCLDKLQRELAYFFDMDLRLLPRVQDLLAAKGYTQIRKGDEIIKLEPSAQADSTLAYTDTKGHTHQIPTDIAQKWLKTFGLKDLRESYTPKFSEQVVKALESTLQGEQITLSANSLVKLMQRDRLEFLPYIKETLEHSDIIIKDKENALIFAKDIGQTSYFTSVSKNDKGEWVISTNSYKTLSQLKNRVSENGEVLYLSKEAPNILAETFTTKAFSNELANDIIPQTAEYNKLLPELFKAFDASEYEVFNKGIIEFNKLQRSIINTLATKEKTAIFVKQLNMPLKNDGLNVYGSALDYKAKKRRGGVLAVSGIMPSQTQLKKESRLTELETERLYLAFAREHNIKGFLGDVQRDGFFEKLEKATREHFKYLHQEHTDSRSFLYTENRILLSDSITQAKQKLQKEREAFKEFLESNTPPKDAPTPPTQKGFFDEVDSSVAYTDTKGHTHQIPTDIAQKWLKTFGLKDLRESYTPQFSEQVAQALEPILQGESIKLYAGSLIKLIKENRLQYLDRIQPTLEQPQRVILQNDGALIFARDFGDEKYFTSVARNDDGEWIIRSNAPKSESGLDNKIAAGGREIYNSQAATQINAHSPYDDIAKSNTKLDSDIIPQEKKLDTPSDLRVEFGANFAEYFSTPRSLANPRARNALRELYHASEKSQDNLALFDKVLEVAGKLKVKTQGKTTRDSAGVYYPAENRLTIRTHMPTSTIRMYGANITQGGQAMSEEDIAQTLLHELIHSTIASAQLALTHKDFAPMAKALTQEQKHALEEIHTLYKLIKREHSHAKKWHTLPINDTYYYGLKNEREFIAELANPNFRDYLQRQNIFMRVINAVLKFFTKAKAKPTDTPTTALESLQNAYMKFLENFNYEHYINTRQEALKGVKDEIQARELESSYTYTTGEAKGIAELRKDLKAALEPSLNKEIVNKEQGLSGVITTEEVKKIISSKAVAKSVVNGFSRDEHIEVAKHIEKLFTESKLLRSHKDYKENPNILQVHRFVKDIEVNGKEANALITLFEKMQGKNKIYTIELESLENLPPLGTQAKSAETAVKAQSAAATPTEAAPIAKTDKLV